MSRRGALLGIALVAGASPAAAQSEERALAVERELERLAGTRVFWPGYDPLSIPLAVFDGQQTYLFRHPSPPAGFAPLIGAVPSAQVFTGRFPAVTSNSSADIGGTATAMVLADGPRAKRPPAELAAVALHEAFHVYQRSHHRGWSGNEGDLLVYPAENSDLLALRRLESDALRRALANGGNSGAACWTRVALNYRRARFAAMDSAFAAYERLTELNEGLAAYIQLLAGGASMVEVPAAEFPAAAVRLRTYTIGPALALLLDRLGPGWQRALEANDKQSLDGLLDSAVNGAMAPTPAPCAFTPVEVAGQKRAARLEAAAVVTGWSARQRAFDTLPGWRVVVQSAAGHPLWPQGFDPLNVDRVEGGLVHTRFLRLGNDAGQMTAIDEAGASIEAHTEGIGPHPLFNGIAWVEVAGLAKPSIENVQGHLVLRGPGLTVDFTNATLRESGQQLLIQLNRAP
jgi:hypothetical protein